MLPLEYTDQRRRLFAQGFVSHLCALTGLSTCAHYIPSAAHWRRPLDTGRSPDFIPLYILVTFRNTIVILCQACFFRIIHVDPMLRLTKQKAVIRYIVYFGAELSATRDGSKTITRPEPVPNVSILVSTAFAYAVSAFVRVLVALSIACWSFSLSGSPIARLCALMSCSSALSTDAFVALIFLLADSIFES
jgi:hypothetical protein